MPLSDADQTCLDFRLSTSPTTEVFAYDTPTGRVHNFNLRAPHNELSIRAESLVVTHRTNPFANLQLVADDSDFYARDVIRQRYFEYLIATKRVPLEPETDRIASIARKQAGVGAASFLIALNRLLHRALKYAPGSTNVNSTLQQVLENRQGVCQDFAHLMLSICRRQGIPARYISGYLYTGEPSDDPQTQAHRLQGGTVDEESRGLISGDAMHAWVECLLPDGNWRGFDPTNNMVTNDYYVKVHYGRDYGDVPPLRGVYRGPFAHTLEVNVHVRKE